VGVLDAMQTPLSIERNFHHDLRREQAVMNLADLTLLNIALHEAGHLCGGAARGVGVIAVIGPCDTEFGEAAAETVHDECGVEDELFFIACGVAASRQFGLGTDGARKDLQDFNDIDADETTKLRARREADEFVQSHTIEIMRMAYALFQMGVINHPLTQEIYDGSIQVGVPLEFLDAIDELSNWNWVRKV
jgi:hypothetical protein